MFWLDVLRDQAELASGVLCRRHADTMVVPRNWTLDDLRDPDLHLFRPPPAAETQNRRARRVRSQDDTAEQLRLGAPAEAVDAADQLVRDPAPAAADVSSVEVPPDEESTDEAPSDEPAGWTPDFDQGDDLDGLLSARSPLLSRAFRGDDLPRN